MSDKRKVLAILTKPELLEVGNQFELSFTQRMNVDELRGVIAGSKRATLPKIAPLLTRERLREACEALGLAVGGSKQDLVDRIVGSDDEAPEKQSTLAHPPSLEPATTPPLPTASLPSPPRAAALVQPIEAAPAPPLSTQPADDSDDEIQSEPVLARPVPLKRPRLVWHGWDYREITTSVPTQVVEIVKPSRFVQRSKELGLDVSRASAPPEANGGPPNRLIWTNDNIVALQTLLEERDPDTRGYLYRGKVDLVYIDPPFMVNADFRADNAIDIDLDEAEGVQVKKEPSLVEMIAYKDTWRQGLDSFLSMLRERLVLLKELLAPTGSIYVHLDWHAVHYVKVLMDEVFGYENFVNEIVWQRQTAHGDSGQGARHLGRIHDTLLFYSSSADFYARASFSPYSADYVQSHYRSRDPDGRRFQLDNLIGPGGAAAGNAFFELLGHTKYWRYSPEKAARLVAEGRIVQPSPGAVPRFKRYLDEMQGVPAQDVWIDLPAINSQAREATGYPTQKPRELLERALAIACPPDGTVLDCFMGSGTTCEAAERLGRRWIGIDNSKYAVHLARKRLIQLHGAARPVEKPKFEYVECEQCKTVERKERPQRSPGLFRVRPFTIENMGVYQRAEQWQGFQTARSEYRDEMVRVFGGTPSNVSPLLHGEKGDRWIHVGPLDSAVVAGQVWSIAREAAKTDRKNVTILSADFNTLSDEDTRAMLEKLRVRVVIRIIPSSAIDEIKRRIEQRRDKPDVPYTSTTIPAFYAPLAIVLRGEARGRQARVTLVRCEVDIDSFLESQQPALKVITDSMSDATRKKAKSERERWEKRRAELETWLAKADSWQKFVDFWSVDWDYGRTLGPDQKPVFVTDWQSFRVRHSKKQVEPLTFTAEREYAQPGQYRVAARVTDVFGNDGIATVMIDVG